MTDMTKLDASELVQFTGTERWYRHLLNPKVTYTDGVKYMAERAGGYWLIDEIALHNKFTAVVKVEGFQVWKLRLDREGSGATLACEDGNDREVYRKRIDFTDFPLPEIDVWFTDDVILLPSEY